MLALVAGSVTMSLSSCSVDNPVPVPDEPQPSQTYSQRMVPVMVPNGQVQGTVVMRYYDDMPSVPYINISDYEGLVSPGQSVTTTTIGPDLYLLETRFGTATVDVAADIFRSDDYEAFTNLMDQVQRGMPNIMYDALPMVRYQSRTCSPEQVPLTLRYGNYGIDLRGDRDGVWMPFQTVADLYNDTYMHMGAFNGTTVLVAPEGAYSIIDGLPAEFSLAAMQATRTAELADYNYRNLCFTLDNFFGYPGRSLIEADMKTMGLDEVLAHQGEGGLLARQMLQSADVLDYCSGLSMLHTMLYDGGHTFMQIQRLNDFTADAALVSQYQQRTSERMEQFLSFYPAGKMADEERAAVLAHRAELTAKREAVFGKGNYYIKRGNTAFCVFNSFMASDEGLEAWRQYYSGRRSRPTVAEFPDDNLCILIDALQQAEADPEVQNFVFDLTTNGGGSSDIVALVTSLTMDKAEWYAENSLLQQRQTVRFDVDRNFDGQFDERDRDVKYHLNFAVLTSSYSFSCANLLPSLMKDLGCLIVGEHSGGGSCGVMMTTDATGICYRYSTCRTRMINQRGENIDGGIEPHVTIDTIDTMYDVEYLGRIIDQYYR